MWTLLASLSFADPTPPVVHELITDQLEAFENADAPRAWKHVAPVLRAQFRTAENFLQVVNTGYPPVVAPRKVTFGEYTVHEGLPAQWLDLIARDGKPYKALYLLEQQPDGSWRTAGCLLFEVEAPKPSV